MSSPSARTALAACALLTMTLLVGCGHPSETSSPPPAENPAAASTSDQRSEIVVRHARAALSPGGGGAIYLELENLSGTDDRLIALETPEGGAEFHETIDDDGVLRMRARPEGFPLDDGETLVLDPGGKHAMLMQLDPAEGQEILSLTLYFEHSEALAVDARVIPVGDHAHH